MYALSHTQPRLARKVGIRDDNRIRQWHLDLAMLGSATTACGVALDAKSPPRVATVALQVGSWTNAMAFLPLAIAPQVYNTRTYRTLGVASFVATTIGFTGVAATVAGVVGDEHPR